LTLLSDCVTCRATELERVSIEWLLDLFGLPDSWSGVLVTGGTMANFTALATARQWCLRQRGVDAAEAVVDAVQPVVDLLVGAFQVSHACL